MAPLDEMLVDRQPEPPLDAIIVVNCGDKITYIDHQTERLFGYGRSELLGLPITVLAPEHLKETFLALLRGARSGTVAVRYLDLVCVHKSSSEIDVEITLTAVKGADAGLVTLAIRNINEQKRAQLELQARARQQAAVSELGKHALTGIDLQQLMEEATCLVRTHLELEFSNVLELQSDGRVVFRAGSGWSDGMVGKTTYEVAGAIPAAEVLRTQAPVVVEDLPDDTRFHDASLLRDHGVVSSLNVPLYGHGRPFGVMGAHSTQTRNFKPEDIAFVQSVANVLSAVLERNWYEERQRERYLQRAEQMVALGQVAAGVAHELRNPLTAVKGLIQVNLRKATAQGLPSQDLVVIEQEIRRMERTLQTFLDFARPPRPNRSPLEITELLDRVLALVAGRAKKQGVVVRPILPDVPVTVNADRDQLQQLLLNLLLNALDALPGGGTVEVDVRAAQDSVIEIIVRDSGPGIPPQILSRIFESFMSTKETGIGLGLPISKRITEEHGGTLSAYNTPGGGACFLLRLPVCAIENTAQTESADRIHDFTGTDDA